MTLANQADLQTEHPGMKAARRWLAGGAKKLLIDGNWVEAQSGRTIEVLNPATEEELARIAEGDKADVDAAVAAARRAFDAPEWKGISPHARTRVLLVIAAVGLTAVATASAGPIAFIALAGPQIARRLTRAPGVPLLSGAWTGAALLLAADLISQRAPLGLLLPIGSMTGLCGGLYLVWLLGQGGAGAGKR